MTILCLPAIASHYAVLPTNGLTCFIQHIIMPEYLTRTACVLITKQQHDSNECVCCYTFLSIVNSCSSNDMSVVSKVQTNVRTSTSTAAPTAATNIDASLFIKCTVAHHISIITLLRAPMNRTRSTKHGWWSKIPRKFHQIPPEIRSHSLSSCLFDTLCHALLFSHQMMRTAFPCSE